MWESVSYPLEFVIILFEDSGFSFETLPTTFIFVIIVFQ